LLIFFWALNGAVVAQEKQGKAGTDTGSAADRAKIAAAGGACCGRSVD